jgi:hypothetical protein
MARQERNTLKLFFRKGALPSADHFADLIESTVNQVDDGFDKTPEDGLKISSLESYDSLISFFRENRSTQALWTIGYDAEQDKLLFNKVDEAKRSHTVLSLTPDGKVGVNRKDPKCALDIAGVVRSEGRIGVIPDTPKCKDRAPGSPVRADGKWHDITDTLKGCHALEVMAGVGLENKGRYAMVHAIAMNAFNPTGVLFNFLKRKNRIKCQHAYYSSHRDKLQLRWEGRGRECRLRIRSRCHYGKDIFIRYYVTRLWLDAKMKGSSDPNMEGFSDVEGEGSFPETGMAPALNGTDTDGR